MISTVFRRFPFSAGNASKKWQQLVIINVFVVLQFFLQGAVGVLSREIKESYGIDAASLSVLSSSFFTLFILLQIPAGMLLDRCSFKKILIISTLLVSLGCAIWALSTSLILSVISRALMGTGSSFAYISLLKSIKMNFPTRQFAFILSISECLSFVGVAFANTIASYYSSFFGWRYVIGGCSLISVLISLAVLFTFVDKKDQASRTGGKGSLTSFFDVTFRGNLIQLLSSSKIWIVGLYSGLSYSVVTVFVALWAIPYYVKSQGLTGTEATSAVSMVYLGIAVSSPIVGWATRRISIRNLICVGTGLAVLFMTSSLYWVKSFHSIYIQLFFLGVSISVYQLSFAIVAGVVSQKVEGTAMGLINMLSMLGAPVLQPLIGMALSYRVGNAVFDGLESYSTRDYEVVLGILPVCVLMAFILTFFIESRKQDHSPSL